jgi:hypothetical protein
MQELQEIQEEIIDLCLYRIENANKYIDENNLDINLNGKFVEHYLKLNN